MQWQNNQVMLNLGAEMMGEARSVATQETEIGTAKAPLESPAAAGPSMELVVERDNMRRALEQVRRNKGASGVDGMTVDDVVPYLKAGPTTGWHLPAGAGAASRDTENRGHLVRSEFRVSSTALSNKRFSSSPSGLVGGGSKLGML
jgi:hypothetical protein